MHLSWVALNLNPSPEGLLDTHNSLMTEEFGLIPLKSPLKRGIFNPVPSLLRRVREDQNA